MRFDLRRSWDLTAIVVLSIALIMVIALLPDNALRVALGLPFILFFPGYSLIAFLFPRIKDLGIIERIALSFGLSIAVTPLIGLGLNYTPFGIRLAPILGCLTAFNIAFSLLAEWRRGRVEGAFYPLPLKRIWSLLSSSFKEGGRLDRALTIILVISIASSLIALAYVIAVPKQGEKFTEFYILGPGGKAADYPTNLTVGEEASLIIGVANHEYRTVYYGVELWLVNSSFEENVTVVHQMLFYDSFNITLNSTEPDIEGNWTSQWELDYSFSVDVEGHYKMWFLLLKDQQEFQGVRYQDYANTGMEELIIQAVEGEILSLNLNIWVSAP
jgi:uncharacterized membrane protein